MASVRWFRIRGEGRIVRGDGGEECTVGRVSGQGGKGGEGSGMGKGGG